VKAYAPASGTAKVILERVLVDPITLTDELVRARL
jgi:hypothetical protein